MKTLITFFAALLCVSAIFAQSDNLTMLSTKADSLYQLNKNEEAIYYLTKLIDASKNNSDLKMGAYATRSACKYELKDYRGAILDANEALSITNNNSVSSTITNKDDLDFIIMDCRATAYLYKGKSEMSLGFRNDACLDWSSAGNYGNKEAYQMIRSYCDK